jgi:hypothetical protein
MIEPAEYIERAKDCADQARTEASKKLRAIYFSMAHSWLTLANQIERQIEAQADRDKQSG